MITTNKLKTLEFLIPSYKRPHTLIQAVESVAKQIEELKLNERVKITIVDDCSPNLNIDEIVNAIDLFSSFVSFKQNDANKGMSLNIRDMVAKSNADFCTVLTDDDRLQPNSLKEIIQTLDSLNNNIGSFFVPRYSYLEDGSLHCIVCNPFVENMLITSSPLNSVKYLSNGFILTGLFFQPKLINFQLWDDNIENSFFPIIYFADLLLNYNCLYVNENWFIHTVLNECHWDRWGKTEQKRLSRLYKDYVQAISISSEKSLSRTSEILSTISLLIEEFRRYEHPMGYFLQQLSQENRNVDDLTDPTISYKLALFTINIHWLIHRLRCKLSRLKSKLRNFLSHKK